MRVRDVWLGFKRPRSCRAFSCMKSWSLVPPQATIFQALVIWEEARRLPSSGGSALPGNPGGNEPGGRGGGRFYDSPSGSQSPCALSNFLGKSLLPLRMEAGPQDMTTPLCGTGFHVKT